MPARVVDENLSHEPRRDGEKVGSALKAERLQPGQAQVRLVHERCALQRVVRALLPKLRVCQPSQLLVDERQESVQGFAVTRSLSLQQLGHLIGRLMLHGSSLANVSAWTIRVIIRSGSVNARLDKSTT